MPNTSDLRAAILFQYDMAWQLTKYHMDGLTDDECLWRPCGGGLHVHLSDGLWHADFPEDESYSIGPPSIAWVTWHIIFWWSMVFDHGFGGGTLAREAVRWPGSAAEAVRVITELHSRWRKIIENMPAAELLSPARTKWPFTDRPFYELAAWLNLELIKNTAELGSGRFLYAVRAQGDHTA